MHYQMDLYSTVHYMHGSAKSFMHVTEVITWHFIASQMQQI